MASHKDNSDYLHIGGVPIKFPWKPYASQLSMMAKIVRGIDRRQNCLLESPTGSGKSLALLCSSLGWQKHEYDKQNLAQQQEVPTKFEEDNTVLQTDPTDCSLCSCYVKDKTAAENPRLEDAGKSSDLTTISGEVPTTQVDDADVFQQDQKKIRTPGSKLVSKTKRDGTEHFNDEMSTSGKIPTAANTTTGGKLFGVNCSCVCHSLATDGKCKEAAEGEDVKFRLPKIYFGTRTHKQIAQIIRELKRTAYGGAKMAILGSREHLCVHPEVSRSHTKNDGCRELLDSKNGTSCRYYANVLKMRHHWQLEGHGLISAWDVEDLVTLGKKIKSCPYFATRNLANEADIIFCPYNYLIDPLIRSSMDIVLKDQIIILDEAHNIEDSAREAASLTIRADDLQDVIDELDKLIGYEWRKEHCQAMHTVAANLQRWITSQSGSLSQNDFNRASKVWTGVEMVAQFGLMGVSPATFDVLKHNFNALLEDPNPTIPVEQMVALSSGSVTLLKGLFIIVDYLFRENMVYMKDYKVALIKEISQQKWRESTNNRWVRVRRDNSERLTYSLNFWCMNPAVAFSDAGGEARTIILTSGTLSPMGSFASELGVAFPISLEANHVIKDSQVWVGSIATGPTGKTLNASYKNTETFNFQDDLGRLVLDVCKSIPYGVLCFFSSYSHMMKLSERWKNTGLWAEISEKKIIMTEARGGMKKEFDEQLREFYATIEDFESRGILDQPLTGVLFLAVCRGKVSEGMDFADNNARAVITVGIPFPSFKDPQVELKRAYNDQNRERGLLSGTEWYEIQAYRALNQALGRCLRHRNDWGALILVDERFRRNPPRYINGLSKWVRNKVNHFLHSSDGVDSLKNFVTRQQKSSQLPACQSTALPQSPSPSLSSESSCDSYHPPMPATPGLFNHSPLQSDRFSRPTAVMHGFPAIAVKNDKGGMEVSCPNPKETSSQFQTPSRTSASNQQLVRKSNVTVSSSQRFISLSSPSLQGSASPRVSAVKLEAVSKTPAHGSFHRYLGQSNTEVISAEHHSGVSPTVFRAAEEFEESPSFVPHCKMRQTTSETPKTLKQQSMTWYLQTLNVEPRLKKLAFSNNVDEVDGQSHPNSSNVSSEDVTRTISTGTESHAEQNANRDSVEGRVSSEEPRGGISNPHCEQNTSEKIPEEERIASEGPGGTPSPHLERITNDNAEEDRVPLEKPVGTPPPLFASEDAVDGDGQQMNPLCYEKSFTHQTLQEVSDANTKEICQTQKALRNETSISLDENKSEIRQVSSDDKDVSSLGNEDLDATLRGTDCISSPSSKISSHKRRRSEGRLRRTSRTANRKTGCDRRKEQEDTIVRNSKRSKVDHFQNAQHDTNEESLSSSAISCPYCGEVICDSGIPIPVGELTSAYLLDKFRLEPEPVQRSPPRKKRPYKNPKGSHALKVDPGVTVNAVPFKSNNHDMNAYWSEEDNCCFQPVCCPTCVNNNPSEPVGYKVVCARRTCNSVTEGEIWFHGR